MSNLSRRHLARHASPEWPEEVMEQLILLWDEKHSTAEIGRRLGKSKNSVVGKVHRLHLDSRPSPIRNPKPPRIHRAPPITLPIFRYCAQCGGTLGADQKRFCSAGCEALSQLAAIAETPRTPKPPKPARERHGFRLGSGECQWMHGNGRPWRACGDAVVLGKSWCPEHYERVFVCRAVEVAA